MALAIEPEREAQMLISRSDMFVGDALLAAEIAFPQKERHQFQQVVPDDPVAPKLPTERETIAHCLTRAMEIDRIWQADDGIDDVVHFHRFEQRAKRFRGKAFPLRAGLRLHDRGLSG